MWTKCPASFPGRARRGVLVAAVHMSARRGCFGAALLAARGAAQAAAVSVQAQPLVLRCLCAAPLLVVVVVGVAALAGRRPLLYPEHG